MSLGLAQKLNSSAKITGVEFHAKLRILQCVIPCRIISKVPLLGFSLAQYNNTTTPERHPPTHTKFVIFFISSMENLPQFLTPTQ